MAKKLVESDYKNHRVEDPTRITSRQENQVKKYVKDFFDKVVAQKKAHDKKKDELRVEREKKEGGSLESPSLVTARNEKQGHLAAADPGIDVSDEEGDSSLKQESATPITPLDSLTNGDGVLKRKRNTESENNGLELLEEEQATPTKRQKSETPPPPPPPPPPASEMLPGSSDISEQGFMDLAMEVDEGDGHNIVNTTNGRSPAYDQEYSEDFPSLQEVPPPPPPLADEAKTDALKPPADDAGDLSIVSPGGNSLARGLGLASERDEGFTAKHFQGVQGIQVHQET